MTTQALAFALTKGRIALLGVLLSILALLCSCAGHGAEMFSPTARPAVPPESESIDDPDARSNWFLFQRTYPNGYIPAQARSLAWDQILESRRRSPQLQSNETSTRWRTIGPLPTFPFFANIGLCSGRINTIAVSPADPRVLIVGAATGGIWRSSDGGNNFAPVSDDQVDLAVGSVAFSRSNPSIVYAGMGDTKLGYLGSGVLKSTDAGQTWTKISGGSLPSPGTIAKVEVDPADGNRVYVALYSKLTGNTIASGGIYVSTDGGATWSRSLPGGARDIVLDAADPRTLYAGVSRIDPDTDPPFGLYRSTDRGASWSIVFSAPAYDTRSRRDIKIAVTPANPQRIFALVGGILNQGLDVRFAVSTDAGVSWSEQVASGFDVGQFGYNSYVVADPQNANTLYVGTRDVYKSTDGGATWRNLTQSFSHVDTFYEYTPEIAGSHSDQHSLAFSQNGSNQFYIGNDGGIWKTVDGGTTFQSLNATLSLGLFTGIALHPTDPSLSFGGTQDNGNQRRFHGTSVWTEFLGGDGGHAVVNPIDPSMVFVTYVRGSIYRFLNNGDSFDAQLTFDSTFGELGTPRMAFYPPFVGNGHDSTLYFGTWRLFVSTDLGNSWACPAGDLDLTKGITPRGADVLSAIGVSSADTRVIYTGSSMGRVMMTTDAGMTWRDITQGLPDRSITSLTVDPGDPSKAYVTLSGFESHHLFRTTDSGSSWLAIDTGLPDIPANAFLIDPVHANTLYVGTDVGVFRSTDLGETWRDFNRGLPPVVIHEFARQSSGLIQIATYGRGVYELEGNMRPLISSVVFDGKKKLTIAGVGFGDAPRILINGQDKTGKLVSSSDTSIKLKGKPGKLGLRTGDNSVQVISSDTPSTPFVFQF